MHFWRLYFIFMSITLDTKAESKNWGNHGVNASDKEQSGRRDWAQMKVGKGWRRRTGEGGGWSEVIPSQDYKDGPSEGQCPPSRCSPARRRFEVAQQHVSERRSRPPTSDPATSPLGLLLLHDLFALLSPPLVDGVAWVVDLKSVLVVHVGILDFSGLLVKLQNVSHPKSDGLGDAGRRDQRRGMECLLNHSPPKPFSAGRASLSPFTFSSIDGT